MAKVADDWKAKGDAANELLSRRDAVSAALAEAVRKPECEGIAWLASAGLDKQLDRIVELEQQTGRHHQNIFAIDLANVLGRFDLASYLLENSPELKPALWAEYRKALLAVRAGRPYKTPAKLGAKGWLATFVPHLALAEALSSNQDPADALAAVDEAFHKRNSDKRGFDPAAIDGDGNAPVNWDLRKRSILAAAGRDA